MVTKPHTNNVVHVILPFWTFRNYIVVSHIVCVIRQSIDFCHMLNRFNIQCIYDSMITIESKNEWNAIKHTRKLTHLAAVDNVKDSLYSKNVTCYILHSISYLWLATLKNTLNWSDLNFLSLNAIAINAMFSFIFYHSCSFSLRKMALPRKYLVAGLTWEGVEQ